MEDAKLLARAAARHRSAMVRFARDLIAIPSFSREEGAVVKRVAAEMRKAGFDSVRVDLMGNVVGTLGHGRTKVMMDAHLDTVRVNDPGSWRWDPFKGKPSSRTIYGRGAADQKLAMVSMVYAARLIKDLGLEDDYTYWAVGSCQEEESEGLGLDHLIRKEGLRPDFVVITEPTHLAVYRGQRGRVQMKVTAAGRSSHASVPEQGVNAVVRMADVIREIPELNARLRRAGKGTIAVTKVDCRTASLNAVPDECTIILDRRLVDGETLTKALAEARALKSVRRRHAVVEVLEYKALSWKGLSVGQREYYPAWRLADGHRLMRAALQAAETALGRKPRTGGWRFSTNGVATAGRLGIPTVGFGPGDEFLAHTARERMPVDQLLKAAVFYAILPRLLSRQARHFSP
ncbi:MAG: YgeY family selenium metabolism-linked hydrolase [Elusimicrobia bacterium]|nr:YgeY family selenium metabolism-linked hydrolase [Elusimicrobiota bacterium]